MNISTVWGFSYGIKLQDYNKYDIKRFEQDHSIENLKNKMFEITKKHDSLNLINNLEYKIIIKSRSDFTNKELIAISLNN